MAASASGAVRLFCFPHAGGLAASFGSWSARSQSVGVHALEYPGRGTRWREPAYSTLASLAADLASQVQRAVDGPYALFGHSFGAHVAYEVARRLISEGAPPPHRLFVSGAKDPGAALDEPIHHLSDDEFVTKVLEYGGTPAELRETPELLEQLLPALRSDFRMFEQSRYRKTAPLPIPITALGGLDDAKVDCAAVLAWRCCTSKSFRCRFFRGGHFFVFDPAFSLVEIADDLAASPTPAVTVRAVS